DFSEVLLARGKYATATRLLLHRRFHAIINLHGGPTSLFYSCMAWGRRVGGEHYRGTFLYNGLVPPPDSAAHTVESTMAIFRWLGLQQEIAPLLRFEKHAAAAARVEETLKGRKYAVIHPGSFMSTKRWEPARFAEVARELSQRGVTIVVTSGPGEEVY